MAIDKGRGKLSKCAEIWEKGKPLNWKTCDLEKDCKQITEKRIYGDIAKSLLQKLKKFKKALVPNIEVASWTLS